MNIPTIRSLRFSQQNGLCCYCSVPMWIAKPQPFAKAHGMSLLRAKQFQCTAEHLMPRQNGGRDTWDNIVAACHYCNHHRHAQRKVVPSPHAYRKHAQRRLTKGKWHGWRPVPGLRSTVETSH